MGASAALMVSDIPWNGPIATVRLAKVDENFIVNPTREQMEENRKFRDDFDTACKFYLENIEDKEKRNMTLQKYQ